MGRGLAHRRIPAAPRKHSHGVPNVTLSNGVEMPVLGFGAYQISAEQTEQAVTDALLRFLPRQAG